MNFLVNFARRFRGFLGIVALFFLGLMFITSFLFSKGSFDPVLAEFGNLSSNQFFTIVILVLVILSFTVLILIGLSFKTTIETQRGNSPQSGLIYVFVHEADDETRGISEAEVRLILPEPKSARTDDVGSVKATFPAECSGKRYAISATKAGYHRSRKQKVKMVDKTTIKLALERKVQSTHNSLDWEHFENEGDHFSAESNPNKAIRSFLQAEKILQSINMDSEIPVARLYRKIGRLYHDLGNFPSALNNYNRGLKALNNYQPLEGPDRDLALNEKAILLTEKAILALGSNDTVSAVKDLEQAITLNRIEMGNTILARAVAYRMRGKVKDFKRLLDEAKAIYTKHNDVAGELRLIGNVAVDELYGGATEDAIKHFHEVLANKYLQSSDKANTYLNLAIAYTDLGNHEEAEKYAYDSLNAHTNDIIGYLMSYVALAEVQKEKLLYFSQQGEIERSQEILDKAREKTNEGIGFANRNIVSESQGEILASLCELKRILAEVFIVVANCSRAKETLLEADEIIGLINQGEDKLESSELVAKIWIAWAKFYSECEDNLESANGLLISARECFVKANLDREIIPLDIYRAQLLLKNGQTQLAKDILERARDLTEQGIFKHKRSQVIELLRQLEYI